jgi:hypothetical protein
MRRRQFIAGLGSAAAWPVVARAQQSERVRRIGVLAPYDESDPEGKLGYSAFTQTLANLGWADGRNLRMDLRWGGGDPNRIQVLAQELVGLQPDIILTNTTPATIAFQRETRTIPIVFERFAPSGRGAARSPFIKDAANSREVIMIGRLHYASRGTALGRGNRDAARLLGTEPTPTTSVAGLRAAPHRL